MERSGNDVMATIAIFTNVSGVASAVCGNAGNCLRMCWGLFKACMKGLWRLLFPPAIVSTLLTHPCT